MSRRYFSVTLIATVLVSTMTQQCTNSCRAQVSIRNPLEVVESAPVRGTVIAEDGTPIKDAMLVNGYGPMSIDSGFVLTDSAGKFENRPATNT